MQPITHIEEARWKADTFVHLIGSLMENSSWMGSVEANNVPLAVLKEAGGVCQRQAQLPHYVAYPPLHTSAFLPISMHNGSWLTEEEPEPPSFERWVSGHLSCMTV
jgi:hypothetical protein